jgi:hypothetical protein
VGFDSAHTRYNGLESGLTKDNAATLTPVWSAPMSPHPGGEPIVAHGTVYATTLQPGAVGVVGLDLADGHVRWDRTVASGLTGVAASPVTMIGGVDGELWMSWSGTRGDGSCDQSTVRLDQATGLTTGSEPQLDLAAPIDAQNSDEGPFVLESTYTGACGPTGDALLRVRDRDNLPVTRWAATMTNPSPGVMVPSVGRNVFVLSEGKLKLFTLGWCGTSPCIPFWELFGMPTSGAVVADGTSQVFVLGGGRIFAVRADTPGVLWDASTSATTLALAGDVVYTVGLDSLGRMVLQTWPRVGCGLPLCGNTSRTVLGPTTGSQPISPVVAGGVVYVADGSLVRAFDISGCTNTVCTPRLLATIQAVGGRITGMTVDAGHLLLATVGTIESFAPA